MSDDYIPSQIILDYYSNPVNYGVLKPFDIKIEGNNSGCSDKVTIYVKFSKDKKIVKNISFVHSGCVISKAGGCIATELSLNKKIDEIINLKPESIIENLDGVLQTRVRCAYLTLNLLKVALKKFISEQPKTPVIFSLTI
ncbi:Fe-S cluster protein [archaeon]|nr:Fe-S cluster protein [archaeon]NCP78999.1 Fe-S cluster protein [archaeon]NCP97618.1 Fe-S cluster protein [archaeon]NCQ06766.1 Fe-S cluster protein [archaeon]NCQ50562.1 Fe-S cluster protein [archaeon]